jgi:ABC-2 type transport system ATP-binding protein
MSTVEEYCEDLVLLHRGRALVSGNLKQIKASYGATKLKVAADADVIPLAERVGMRVLCAHADGVEFLLPEPSAAQKLLSLLVENSILPTKFEVLEPSLNEIFIEKVNEITEAAK